jgi:hypothetical protein
MDEPLENAYFKWLCAKVIQSKQPSTPSLTYWKLLHILHSTEFVWLLQGDDNRAADGVELRGEFIFECKVSVAPDWRDLGCSLLEMLIGFSRRAQFTTGIPAQDWFWEFLDNLHLIDLNDGANFNEEDVEDILDGFIWRTYNMDGEGGILPLNNPPKDQRHVEIWYQFSDYVVDRNKIP